MTDVESNLLLVHIIRLQEIRTKAILRTKGGVLFDRTMQAAHAAVWDAIKNVHKAAPEEEPTEFILNSDLEALFKGNDPEGIKDAAQRLVSELCSIDKDQLMTPIGMKYLDACLMERMRVDWHGKLQQLYTQADLTKFINGASSELSTISETTTETLTQPLLTPDKVLVQAPKEPTGVSFWDEIAGGGFSKGEVIGFLGPTGGGKTTLACQTVVEQAKRKKDVLLILYEQPVSGDIAERLYANILDYDVDIFRGITQADWPEEVQEQYEKVAPVFGKYIHVKDMTVPRGLEGANGIQDVKNTIQTLADKDQLPRIVIIDWFMPMIKRYLAKNSMPPTNEMIRSVGYDILDTAGVIARDFGINIIINHQLDTKTARASSRIAPKVTDAMELKSFAFNIDACFLIGNRDRDSNIAIFLSDKNRRAGIAQTYVRLMGEKAKLVPAKEYIQDHRGRFVKKDALMPTGDDLEIQGNSYL